MEADKEVGDDERKKKILLGLVGVSALGWPPNGRWDMAAVPTG